MSEIIFDENREALFKRAVEITHNKIRTITDDKIVIAIPGGRSIVGYLEAFAASGDALPRDVWERLEFFIVDERLVPIDHEDSNYKLVSGALANLVSLGLIRESQLHPFHYRADEDDAGLSHYIKELEAVGGRYHIALLGVGEDAHIGALFPGHVGMDDAAPYFIQLSDSPKPPPMRMTSSVALLKNADLLMALFTGEAKREALERYLDPGVAVADCPAKIIDAVAESYVITDLSRSP